MMYCPLVPQTYYETIFRKLHSLSHGGVKATTKLIGERYVFSGMRAYIKEKCRSCLACQKSKITRHNKTPLKTFQDPPGRFQVWHIDLYITSGSPIMGVYLWGSPDYGSMVQSDSWLYLSLTYVKSTTLYSIKYLLLIQPNYNTQTLFNKISSNLTIEWNRMNRMPSIPPKRMPRMESNNRITIE